MGHVAQGQKELDIELAAGTIYEGIVVDDPGDVATGIQIRLVDQDKSFGPMPWPARGILTPNRGDQALFIRSDQGLYWCIAWWPYDN